MIEKIKEVISTLQEALEVKAYKNLMIHFVMASLIGTSGTVLIIVYAGWGVAIGLFCLFWTRNIMNYINQRIAKMKAGDYTSVKKMILMK